MTTPLILLDEKAILPHLKYPAELYLVDSIDSTNQYLKNLPDTPNLAICCAETQTQGRGRFGRHWHSPFGENIYCSSRWYFDCDYSDLSGVGLVVSMAIVAALIEFNLEKNISIKWPNDILWNEKKICGSLLETSATNSNHIALIIGIGLNVNSTGQVNSSINKPWASLHDISGRYYDRNLLIANLINYLNDYLNQFLKSGLSSFKIQWQKLDYLLDKEIIVSQSSMTLQGTARGIDTTGQLLLVDRDNNVHSLSSGDTTLALK